MKCQTPLGATNIVATCSTFKEAMVSPIPLLSKMTKPLSNFLTSTNLRLSYEAQGTWLKIEKLWRRMAHTFDQSKQHTFWKTSRSMSVDAVAVIYIIPLSFALAKLLYVQL